MPAIPRPLSLRLLRISAFALAAAIGAPVAHAGDVEINNATEEAPPFSMSPTDDLIVGTDAVGVLNILGDTVMTNSTVLGRDATGNGTINVSSGGFGGPSSPLTIGYAGTGTVSAIGPGNIYIYSQETTLGALSGSSGTATLSGASAEWNVLGNLVIGGAGTGTFNLLDGANLNHVMGNTIIGQSAGSQGTFVIDNTAFTTADLTVGGSGTGILSVSNGASLTTNNGYVGNSGGTGTVNVSGAGSLWTLNSSLYIGYDDNATGTVNVTNGATLDLGSNSINISYNDAAGFFNVSGGSTVTSGAAYLGYYSDTGVGVANISGAGTIWTVNGEMRIGDEGGAGELNVLDRAHVNVSGDLRMGGYDEGVTRGDLLVSGASSEMTVGGTAYIGYERPAIVTVSNGGLFQVTGETIISYDDTAPAEVTVTGAGSRFQSGDVQIGYANGAEATLNLTNGASADTGSVYVGSAAGSTGTLNISGADTTWAGGSTFYAGYSGIGTINISGGTVFDPSTNYMNYLHISENAGSQGTVNISGAGTEVTVDQYIYLGNADRGVLNITDGAVVTTDYLYGAVGGAASDLLVSGAGTALNIYYGAYIGSGATLNAVVENGAQLSATSASVQINNDSTLTVRNGGSVTGANGIIVGGSTNGTMILSTGSTATATNGRVWIAQTGGHGSLVFGAKEGSAAVAAGTLNSAQVIFGNNFSVPSVSGEIVFNHTGAMTFGSDLSVLSGTGHELKVLAGTTTFTGNSSTFTGDMIVTGGKAVINSNYSQTDVEVSGGGVVGGDGTIASLNVLSGGTVAPGNSPGTIHIVEGVTFASGSNYAVEVAGAQSDLIAAGSATLNGGTVHVSGTPSLMRYAILTTALAPITGTGFSGVDTTSAFVLYSLDYDPNNVYLVIDGYKSLTTAARTANQYAVANALDYFPKDNPLYSTIIGGNVASAAQAFNALSGEIHGSVGTALADDSRYVREAITGRLIQAYYGGAGAAGGGQAIVMAAAAPTDVVEMDSSSRMSLGAGYGASRAAPAAQDLAWWSRAFGAWGQYDSNGNAATTDRNLGGFVTGVDGNVGGGWRAGLATGYMNTSLSAGGERYSSADINSYVLGAYAGGGIGQFAFRSGGTWTWNRIDTDRNVIFPGFSEAESASYNGDVGQLFAEVGLPIFTHGGVIEPFAGLAYVHVGTDSFTESGTVAGLTSGGLNMNLGYGSLGARVGTTMVWGGTTVIPHASAAWQYAFGDTTPQIALAFVSTGIGMGIGGVPLAQNSALLDIGADAVIAEDVTLGISYMGQYSGDFTDNGLRGRFNWKF